MSLEEMRPGRMWIRPKVKHSYLQAQRTRVHCRTILMISREYRKLHLRGLSLELYGWIFQDHTKVTPWDSHFVTWNHVSAGSTILVEQ